MAFIGAGTGALAMISKELRNEEMVVESDSPFLADQRVRGPLTAYAEAQIIDAHTRKWSGGRTFAQLAEEGRLAQEAGETERLAEIRKTQKMVQTGSTLRAALFTPVIASGVALMAIGVGTGFVLVGGVLKDR